VSVLIGLGVQGTARAQCAEVYGAGALGAQMTTLHKALKQSDLETMASAGAQLSAGLPCTDIVPPVPALAGAYRFIGVHHAIAGRANEASGYFRTAIELDPNFEWGVKELAKSPAIRAMYEAAKPAALVDPERQEGAVFTPPEGGEVYVDGRKAKHVEATADRPHLVQVVVGDRASQTHLVMGSAFPAGLVGAATAATVRTGGSSGPVRVSRLRPPAKTPLLVVGGVSLAAGAGLYAASFAARSSFDSATTTEDLMKHQSATNALVIASAATVVVGLGTGYAGFILSGRPGIVYHLSY